MVANFMLISSTSRTTSASKVQAQLQAQVKTPGQGQVQAQIRTKSYIPNNTSTSMNNSTSENK